MFQAEAAHEPCCQELRLPLNPTNLIDDAVARFWRGSHCRHARFRDLQSRRRMSESRTQRSTRPGIGYRQPALRAELIEFCTAAIVPTSLAVAAESAPRRSTNLQVARLSRMDVPASSSPNVDTSNPQQPTETSRNSCEAGAPRLRRTADTIGRNDDTYGTGSMPCAGPKDW
jgi:hypothetical protein